MGIFDSVSAITEPEARILEFEAIRGSNLGAKLRLTLSHRLQFGEMPPHLLPDQNASRARALAILPQDNTNETEPPGARLECGDFLVLQDLRDFHEWLHATFSSSYEHYTTDCVETEFLLKGSNRSLEFRFRSGIVAKKRRTYVTARIAAPPLQRDDCDAHWTWVAEKASRESAFLSEFGFFFDPECLRLAAGQLGEYLRRYGLV